MNNLSRLDRIIIAFFASPIAIGIGVYEMIADLVGFMVRNIKQK